LTDTAPLRGCRPSCSSGCSPSPRTTSSATGGRLAHDIARATVRASFRRFFPASAATLVPERRCRRSANVWSRYQSWGTVSSMPIHVNETVVRITGTPRNPELCMWTTGMLEQLVVLSGGRGVAVDHEACEARDDDACLFRVMWGPPGVGAQNSAVSIQQLQLLGQTGRGREGLSRDPPLGIARQSRAIHPSARRVARPCT